MTMKTSVQTDAGPRHAAHSGLLALGLGAVGVVYGDVGTSPLYALREALHHAAADGLARVEVLGIVSLLLWALIIIVTVKYVLFLVRLDNQGEGGTLSLLALFQAALGRRTSLVLGLAVAGTALFYADAMITPAISVLSAVEGLKLVTPALDAYVVPLTLAVLLALFALQSRGTSTVGRWFGPIMAVWFAAMAVAGLRHIGDDPHVLTAFDPRYALLFLGSHGALGFTVLGSVFLAVTGAEALYTDMGHFGRDAIQLAWLGLVFPALALNYLGQGALVLARPEALENPFFLLVPEWALLPMVLLATAATVIASQAVITGAFSVTKGWFSERAEAVGDDEDAGGGQQGQDDAAQPVLTPVQPLVGEQPGAAVLDHAADRAEPRAVRLAYLADVGWMPSCRQSARLSALCVGGVGVQPADGRRRRPGPGAGDAGRAACRGRWRPRGRRPAGCRRSRPRRGTWSQPCRGRWDWARSARRHAWPGPSSCRRPRPRTRPRVLSAPSGSGRHGPGAAGP